ncbi:MAG: hemolysin family protein [Sporomusaceae bacterium]|nr:hemolysin family protein [Sporomusaceae bacterium]
MDTPSLGSEIGIIFLLIVANGFFALAEMAIVSSRASRLEHMASQGDRGAARALKLAQEPTDMLSAVQVGITLIGIMTGAFGGATLSGHLAVWLKEVPALARFADPVSLVLVVAVITYVSLVVGELVPKRIALNNPEPIAVLVARPIGVFVFINRPLVRLLSFSTRMVLALLRAKPPDEPPVTEEEVKVMIGQGAQHGVFEESEREMVENIFQLSDMRAGALMTPRVQIEWLDLEDSAHQNLNIIADGRHSCFPVARGSLDEIVGVVFTKDLLADHVAGKELDLEQSAREPIYVPRSMPALKMLEAFKEEKMTIALVIDEFGGIDGLVTLNDIMEHIVGGIALGEGANDEEAVRREDGSWLLDGMMDVEDFKELFGFGELPEEERAGYQTLGGFVISFLGDIPQTGDSFTWGGYRFEVVDMDRTRVDKVLVLALPPENDNGIVEYPSV